MYTSQPSTSSASHSLDMNASRNEQDSNVTLKFKYMSLLDEANEIAGTHNVRESLAKIDTVLGKAAVMFPLVEDTTAMVMDAKVFALTTDALERATENIDVGEGVFNLYYFADQFRKRSLNEDGQADWKVLAAVAPPVVQNSIPHWTPLLGSFEFSVEVGLSQQKKPRHVRQKDEVVDKKEPLKNVQGASTQEGVEKMVQRVLNKLKHHYQIERAPLNYFKFVVNPHSFSDTVENIFHVSFLVNDGLAKVDMGDEYPLIYPHKEKENTNPHSRAGEDKRKQIIMPMDMDLWEGLILAYNIKTSMI